MTRPAARSIRQMAACTRSLTDVIARCSIAVALLLIWPRPVESQEPWTVTVTPTLNPLPIGTCAAVWLKIYDAAIGETPRNPTGTRVTLADFDMVVTTPDGKSAAGKHDGPALFLACACQGGAVGTVATVMATYPAQSLPAERRIAGVAITSRASFTLGQDRGPFNPPACVEQVAKAGSRSAGSAAAKASTQPAPAPAATPVIPAATPVTVVGPPPGGPPAQVTVVTQPPPKPSVEVPAPGRQSGQPAAPGRPPRAADTPETLKAADTPEAPPVPAPTNVVVTGSPAMSMVSWTRVPDASVTYSVERWKADAPECCRNSKTNLVLPYWFDTGIPEGGGQYVYRVSANYADGRQGVTSVTYNVPSFRP